MDFDRARGLLPDYALGLLDEDEAAEVEAWVARSEELRQELAVYSEAGEALLLGVEPAELDAEMLERLAAGVRSRIDEGNRGHDSPEPRKVPGASAPRSVGRYRALAAIAAVFVVGVGLAIAMATWSGGESDPEGDTAGAALQLPLHGDSGEGQVSEGQIYVSADFGSGVAYFPNLAPAPNEHHYTLWSDGPGGPQKAASFQGEGDELYVSLPALPREMTRMYVTVEADANPPALPTGPEVLSTSK